MDHCQALHYGYHYATIEFMVLEIACGWIYWMHREGKEDLWPKGGTKIASKKVSEVNSIAKRATIYKFHAGWVT